MRIRIAVIVAVAALAGPVVLTSSHSADAAAKRGRLVLDVPVAGGSWRLYASGTVRSASGVQRPSGVKLPKGVRLVDAAPTPSGRGFYAVTGRGRLLRRGDAPTLPRLGSERATGQVAALATTRSGRGAYVLGANGTMSTYGDAARLGTPVGLTAPVTDLVLTPSGNGYWMVTSTGSIFAFGDAAPFTSVGAAPRAPVTAIVPTPSGQGLWAVAADGGVFAIGDAPFMGSLSGATDGEEIVGIQPAADGYVLLGSVSSVDYFGPGGTTDSGTEAARRRPSATTTTAARVTSVATTAPSTAPTTAPSTGPATIATTSPTTRPTSTTTPPPTTVPTTSPSTTTATTATTTTAPTTTTTSSGLPPVGTGLSAAQKLRSVQLISLFENSTLELQYGYISNLNDGRGYTAGRAGFTSGTGDLVLVVRRYVAAVPSSPLAAYLPELDRLAASASSNVSGLGGFVAAWQSVAGQQAMRDAQDQIVDDLYFRPAMSRAAQAGIQLPLALMSIYDTNIQHGEGTDPDGMPSILAEAIATAGRPANTVAAQSAWLRTFLSIRRAHLSNAHDPATRAAWAASVGRVDTLVSLLDRGIVMLDSPFTVNVYGDTFTVP
jgi:chitosanase